MKRPDPTNHDALVEGIISPEVVSAIFSRRDEHRFAFAWHRHTHYELTFIEASAGTRLVGDDVSPYGPGDLVLLGPMVPHTWASATHVSSNRATVVHFHEDAIPAWPESASLEPLLDAAGHGIHIRADYANPIGETLRSACDRDPLQRITTLVYALAQLAGMPPNALRPLSARPASQTTAPLDPRVERALAWIDQHHRSHIAQADVAQAVDLTPPQFSRLFRATVGRTFTTHVQATRIATAAQLLATTDNTVTDIAFASGFGTMPGFNRVFRQHKNCTPTQYRHARRGPIDTPRKPASEQQESF